MLMLCSFCVAFPLLSLGWSSRTQFEETWATLLGVLVTQPIAMDQEEESPQEVLLLSVCLLPPSLPSTAWLGRNKESFLFSHSLTSPGLIEFGCCYDTGGHLTRMRPCFGIQNRPQSITRPKLEGKQV